jgi:CheY-like chemotaxis protein
MPTSASAIRRPMAMPFTILFAEDDGPVRDVVINMLSEKGFSVLIAEDWFDALRILRERAVDVLFTDILMPGMDGVALAREARAVRPGLKVLFTTGYAGRALERGALRSGRILYKPFRQAALIREIESLLAT